MAARTLRGRARYHTGSRIRKGSADIASNALIPTWCSRSRRSRTSKWKAGGGAPGQVFSTWHFSLRDPILRDVRVGKHRLRHDRRPMIQDILGAVSRGGRQHPSTKSWAYDGDVPKYEFDPERARRYSTPRIPSHKRGALSHRNETSTEETTR